MKKVILNVGHGGVKKDPGACANGFEEHAWNKDFVNNYIVPECKEQGVDYIIVYQDYYSKLPDKINDLANKGDVTTELKCYFGTLPKKVKNWRNFYKKLILKQHI